MREIKFRAWDKNKKHFIGYAEYVIYPNSGEVAEMVSYNAEYDKLSVKHDALLEQFTGLHDKNGKEVYEGDIVNCSEGCPHKIIWVQEHGGMFIVGMPGWYLSGLKDGYAWGEDEEVIGNIHENPELLEDVDD